MINSQLWNPKKIEEILKGEKAIIIYDGICNLCDFCMKFLRKRNQNELLYFLPYQELVKIFYWDSN